MFMLTIDRRKVLLRGAIGLAVIAVILVARMQLSSWGILPATGQLRPIQRADTREPKIALTFNLTWGTLEPVDILNILQEKGVKATFFVGGTWAVHNPDLLKRIIADGHEVGTMGFKMQDLSKRMDTEVAQSLKEGSRVIETALGKPPRFFRPPHGKYSDMVIQAALAQGLTTVTWSLDSGDSTDPLPKNLEKTVIKKARRGDIVLFHAQDWIESTSQALPQIVEGLRRRGFRMMTVSEMFPPE